MSFCTNRGGGICAARGARDYGVPGRWNGWRALGEQFGRTKLGEDLAAELRAAKRVSGSGVAGSVLGRELGNKPPAYDDEAATKTYFAAER